MLILIALFVMLKWCPTLQNQLMRRYKAINRNMRKSLDFQLLSSICYKHLQRHIRRFSSIKSIKNVSLTGVSISAATDFVGGGSAANVPDALKVTVRFDANGHGTGRAACGAGHTACATGHGGCRRPCVCGLAAGRPYLQGR